MAAAADARRLFAIVRQGIDVRAIGAHVRKPFRFLLCGDPALVAELRALLLTGHDDGASARCGGVPRDDPLGGAARDQSGRGARRRLPRDAAATRRAPISARSRRSRCRSSR